MYRILIVARDHQKAEELDKTLSQEGFTCIFTKDMRDILLGTLKQMIDLALFDLDGSPNSTWAADQGSQIQEVRGKQLPVMVLISKEKIHDVELIAEIDDFVVKPCDTSELLVRIKRLIKKTSSTSGDEIIQCGDLVIDPLKCEIYLEGRLITLTFKEYELLKFLAINKGRVFSRDSLLNEVWGYDYYGGDRTVDVHIRRLRSKIEDPNHIFIDTARNMGYRFRERDYSPISDPNSVSG